MIERLAVSLGINNDKPNIELAKEIAEKEDSSGLDELVTNLDSEDKRIASNCIKVLYETGYRKPELIASYAERFVSFLTSKNNRLVWGSMAALAQIADLRADYLYENLDTLIKAYEKGSVITIDAAISVFTGIIIGKPETRKEIFPLLIKHLELCRPKEVPQHGERIFPCLNEESKDRFIQVIKKRESDLSDSQKKRTNKLLSRL